MSNASPTLGGFITFIINIMNVPAPFDPNTSPYVVYAYNFATNFINPNLACIPNPAGGWTLFAVATYNLAADTLINFAQDAPDDPIYKNDLPYWAWLRQQYGVLNFVAGVVQSTNDEGTGAGYMIPKGFENYTIANLGNLKTPYGRQYLGIAQSYGTLWGLS